MHCFLLSSPAFAVSGWFDNTFRRPIEVIWDAEHGGGTEVCYVEMYTGGHLKPDGSDLRVSTEDGRQVAAQAINIGPGDRVSFIFTLTKGVKKYYAYFGNPTPTENKPAFATVKIESGVLMEMRQWAGGKGANYEPIEDSWKKAGPLIGRTMIDTTFIGMNPFGPAARSMTKYTASLFVPLEGEYAFAMFVEDYGVLMIDGEKVLTAKTGPADVSQQAKIRLKRGRHDLVLYQISTREGRLTLAWSRPDMKGFVVIPRPTFGIFARGIPGALEEFRKPVVADCEMRYEAECFYEDGYSHRYKFTAREPRGGVKATYDWDFGDGQTASGSDADHVYLTDGIYPVKLTIHAGVNTDSQTNKLAVSRNWPHLDNPPTDKPNVQSPIVGQYDLWKMPADWLPRATLLHERAGRIEPMLAVAALLAALPKHPERGQAIAALEAASAASIGHVIHGKKGTVASSPDKTDATEALRLWAAVPPESDLHPQATRNYAHLLLWNAGDIPKAVQVLQPFSATKDPVIDRLYGVALVLNGKLAEGRKILESLPISKADLGVRAAKSGALARTIEFYIESKDWETGEDQWDRWQQQFPTDFMEGYSVLLKVKLMELKGATQGASNVAEAFAKAVPGSSYSPQLLFKAAKWIEKTDATKSTALIKLLKDRYPEDPLSQ